MVEKFPSCLFNKRADPTRLYSTFIMDFVVRLSHLPLLIRLSRPCMFFTCVPRYQQNLKQNPEKGFTALWLYCPLSGSFFFFSIFSLALKVEEIHAPSLVSPSPPKNWLSI